MTVNSASRGICGFWGKTEASGFNLPEGAAGVSYEETENRLLMAQWGGPALAVSADGRYRLALCGKVYSLAEVSGPISGQAVLDCLIKHGPRAGLAKLNGVFALALWDSREKTLSLARDQFGMHPLYYALFGNCLAYSSTLAGLYGFPEFNRAIDIEALTSFIKHNFIPGNISIYQQIKKLPPGGVLVKKASAAPELVSYFDPVELCLQGAEAPYAAPERELCDRFYQILRDSAAQVNNSANPSVLLLSGGMDSSLLLAVLSRLNPGIETLTVGFADNNFDESKIAAQFAGHLGVKHHIRNIERKDVQRMLLKMYDIYEEPYADASLIPTSFAIERAVGEFAARDIYVGDGGDDFFMGYVHMESLRKYAIAADPQNGAYGLKQYLMSPWRSFMHFLFGKDISYAGKWNANRLYRKTMLRAGKGNALSRAAARAILIASPVRRALITEVLVGTPGLVAVKCRRPADYYGVNLYAPIINKNLFIFAQHLPQSLLYQPGVNKLIMDKLLARFYPPSIFQQPKRGFSVPLMTWLKGPMREWAEEMIDERSLRQQGYFNAAFIRKIWESNSRHLEKIWSVFMFQAWLSKQRDTDIKLVG